MCYSEWRAYQLRSRGNEGRTYCHISPLNNSLVSLRLIGIQMEWFISHKEGGVHGGGWRCGCVRAFGWRGSTNETMFSQQKEGVKEENWPSTELWFHFGDIESLDQTSEATKEQFSVPITAHSSWCDCCVTVISLVGGRRATAESLHKNSLPVTLAWKTGLCVFAPALAVFMDALFVCMHMFCVCICVCACSFDTSWLFQASFITSTHSLHLPTSISCPQQQL